MCSECETVFLHRYHKVGLQVALALLSNPVPVEGGWFSTEKVWLVLKVVIFQVVKESGSHVSVIRARSQSGEHH